jgi:hypothetical protein
MKNITPNAKAKAARPKPNISSKFILLGGAQVAIIKGTIISIILSLLIKYFKIFGFVILP